jgi:hypothetical protein
VFGHAADHTLVSHRHRNEEVSADDEPGRTLTTGMEGQSTT